MSVGQISGYAVGSEGKLTEVNELEFKERCSKECAMRECFGLTEDLCAAEISQTWVATKTHVNA